MLCNISEDELKSLRAVAANYDRVVEENVRLVAMLSELRLAFTTLATRNSR